MPYELDETEAATALAIVFARSPMITGINALNEGLREAMDRSVLDDPELVAGVSPATVAAYRKRITSQPQVMFPEPELRTRMLEVLRGGQRAWRKQDPATRPTAPLRSDLPVTLPRTWSKHERADGTPVIIVELPHVYDLTQSATALALAYPNSTVARYENKLRTGLQTAARQGLLASAPEWSPDLPARAAELLPRAEVPSGGNRRTAVRIEPEDAEPDERLTAELARASNRTVVARFSELGDRVPLGPSVTAVTGPLMAWARNRTVWTYSPQTGWVWKLPYAGERRRLIAGLHAPDPLLVDGYRARLLDGVFDPE